VRVPRLHKSQQCAGANFFGGGDFKFSQVNLVNLWLPCRLVSRKEGGSAPRGVELVAVVLWPLKFVCLGLAM
jgi:hypothetical protein